MNQDLDLTFLECASAKRQKHFLIQPFSLTCGHFMVHGCIQIEKQCDNITCGICKDIKKANLENNQSSILINQVIQTHIEKLFDIVSNKCTQALNETKSKFVKYSKFMLILI